MMPPPARYARILLVFVSLEFFVPVSGVRASPPRHDAALGGVVPRSVEAVAGEPTLIAGEFVATSIESLRVTVRGLVSGLSQVDGVPQDGRKQVRLYGSPGLATPPGSVFAIEWKVSSGSASRVYRTSLRVGPPLQSNPKFEEEVTRFYTVEYYHGLPRMKARGFGRRSLPILARLLRDPSAKRSWHQIAAGIGLVGDPTYFDTLRSFIWETFRGPVDSEHTWD